MGHHAAIKTFAMDDIPRGYTRDTGLEYDMALIYDFEPEYVRAKCKVEVEKAGYAFPIDVGWLVANSPIGFAANENKDLLSSLEKHDVLKIAKQYLHIGQHCLSLSRN